MAVEKIFGNMHILDNGQKGRVDGEDTIYMEENGRKGLQEGETVVWSGQLVDRQKMVSRYVQPLWFSQLGMEKIDGLSIGALSQYVTAYQELKGAAGVREKNDEQRAAFEMNLSRFRQMGEELLRREGVESPLLEVNPAIASLMTIDEKVSPKYVFRGLEGRLGEWKEIRAQFADSKVAVCAASDIIANILTKMEYPAEKNPELLEKLAQYVEEEENFQAKFEAENGTVVRKSTPADVLEREKQLVNNQIHSLDEILRSALYHPKTAEILFRKAELSIERDDITAKLNGSKPDYSESIRLYKDVIQKFPEFERIDEVMYRLAAALIQNNKAKEGASYVSRLTKQFPASIYLPNAYKLVADYYYENELFPAARINYWEALRYYNVPKEMHHEIFFRMAAAYAGMGEWSLALDTFRDAVEYAAKQ